MQQFNHKKTLGEREEKMSIRKFSRNFSYLIVASFFFIQNIAASSLDGTSSVVYKNQHHVFNDGEIAKGFVRLNKGFTIVPGARATLDTVVSVSGPIDLRRTGRLQLVTDLQLDTGVTLSSGGYLGGRGYTLDFNGSFTVPRSEVLHIISDTVIDGNGGTLFLDSHAHLFIEQDVTLTLRNLFVRSKINSPFLPPLVCGGNGARLALDNVGIKFADDFVFSRGQLFIHRDVFITGTNSFIYKAAKPLLIDSKSLLAFDVGSSFTFAPTTTDQKLLIFKDSTSGLFLNGANFNTTSTGVRLTKGALYLENKVVFNTVSDVEVANAVVLTSSRFGNFMNTFSWRPDGRYIAVSGQSPNPYGFSSNNRDDIFLYELVNSTLITVTSQSYKSPFLNGSVFAVDWSADGQYLAIGGEAPAAGVGGFSNGNNVRVYRFDGNFLVPVTTASYPNVTSDTTYPRWSPDQRYLIVTGEAQGAIPGPGVDTLVYRFNGTSLTLTTSRRVAGGSLIWSSKWSPDGKFIAIASTTGNFANTSSGFANTDGIKIYRFDGSTLIPVASQPFGGASADARVVDWSPDGKFLLVTGSGAGAGFGGFADADNLRIYAFNGTSLMPIVSHGNTAFPAAWHPNGKYLSCTLTFSSEQTRFFKFDGTNLNQVALINNPSSLYAQGWDPSGKVFGTGLNNIDLYSTTFSNPLNAITNGLILGDSASGSSFNSNLEVLGGAHVTINGIVNDDSV